MSHFPRRAQVLGFPSQGYLKWGCPELPSQGVGHGATWMGVLHWCVHSQCAGLRGHRQASLFWPESVCMCVCLHVCLSVRVSLYLWLHVGGLDVYGCACIQFLINISCVPGSVSACVLCLCVSICGMYFCVSVFVCGWGSFSMSTCACTRLHLLFSHSHLCPCTPSCPLSFWGPTSLRAPCSPSP